MYRVTKIIVCSLLICTSHFLTAGNTASSKTEAKSALRRYSPFNYPSRMLDGNTFLNSIRKVKKSAKTFYITGFYTSSDETSVVPFVYKGRLSGKGKWHVIPFPSRLGRTIISTQLYGSDNGKKSNHIQLVGNYTVQETDLTLAFLYEGRLDGSGRWKTLTPKASEPVVDSTAHSIMGGVVVGNYSTQVGIGRAFIYNIKRKKYYEIKNKDAQSIRAYGIWHNGGSSYTICGSYEPTNGPAAEVAYVVDWNAQKNKLRSWRSFSYQNDPTSSPFTYFNGISSDGHGGYTLTGNWIGETHGLQASKTCQTNLQTGCPEPGFLCHITKKGTTWSALSFPGQFLTSGNALYKKVVLGGYIPQNDFLVHGYISKP